MASAAAAPAPATPHPPARPARTRAAHPSLATPRPAPTAPAPPPLPQHSRRVAPRHSRTRRPQLAHSPWRRGGGPARCFRGARAFCSARAGTRRRQSSGLSGLTSGSIGPGIRLGPAHWWPRGRCEATERRSRTQARGAQQDAGTGPRLPRSTAARQDSRQGAAHLGSEHRDHVAADTVITWQRTP
jgi:hypothetical protein